MSNQDSSLIRRFARSFGKPLRYSLRLQSVIAVAFAAFLLLPAKPNVASTSTPLFAGLPSGFAETQVASQIASPTAMAFAPDGRLFVCEQGGALRVIKNDALLATPFVTLTVNSSGERGLLGVAFDPDFTTNNFVYVYYTATTPTIHNRISRFTATGDVAVTNSEFILLDLDDLGATNHNGGAIHFGPDGHLYAAVGENAVGPNAQSFLNLHGKILRIHPSGAIPSNNPFDSLTMGKNKAIWAMGLRNPFTFSFQPGTGRMFINDVGEGTREEINDGIAGLNYGWPNCEGICSPPNANFRDPIYNYANDSSTCAITGGTFYNPAMTHFPPTYIGKYFFSDYCGGWIKILDPANGNTVTDFATGITLPVDLQVSADGRLYYLARGSGSNTGVVFKIQFTGSLAPTISQHPANQTVTVGSSATFTVQANGTPPLNYQWQRNGVNLSGATSSSITLLSAQLSDNGALFRCVVSNAVGSATSNQATLTVVVNQSPTATITQPTSGTLYNAGQTINYSGTGSDPEDVTLPAAAFTWRVDFHHDTHTHPFVPDTSGITSGSFVVPTIGETSANVWYRIYLTVRDSGGLQHMTFRDITPRTTTVTITTNPGGLQLTLDGQPRTAPIVFVGVVGIQRSIGTSSPQTLNGRRYRFKSWSDGGTLTHNITTPAVNTTYTARFLKTK